VRRRLSFLVAATTSAVVLAFLVPLALVLRTLAEDRAIAAATSQSQTLLAVAAAVGTPSLDTVGNLVGARAAGITSLHLPDGSLVGPRVEDPFVLQARQAGQSFTRAQGEDVVVYATSIGPKGVLVARTQVPETLLHADVARDTALVAGLGLLLLLAAVLAADRLALRVSAPIRDLAAAADAMREGSLAIRVPEEGTPEVVALAGALNRLAARVEELLAAERDAVANLSHRLRTPVTALRLDTEGLADPETAERLREHVTQLERTIDAIVSDARRPTRSHVTTSCDVTKVVAERVAFWSALADDQGRPLRLALPDRPLRARLDASELADVVDVLIDNVFAHTDEGVGLEVWLVPRADGAVVLTVEDGGPGLPGAEVVARGTSGAGSSGLGLDIVRRAALASGGSLELGRSRLGGALVRLVLGPADD
jgi:signal transduction histidine kinase